MKFQIGDIVVNVMQGQSYLYEIIDVEKDGYIFMFLSEPDPVGKIDVCSQTFFDKYYRKLTKLEKALK